MTPKDAVKKLKEIDRKIKIEVRKAEVKNLRLAAKVARQFSSGEVSTVRLRRFGHPYAKRDPNAAFPPGIVNKQTGQLKSAWTHRIGEWQEGNLSSKAFNTSVHGMLIESGGTANSAMVKRPIVDYVQTAIAPARKQRIEDAIRKALKP